MLDISDKTIADCMFLLKRLFESTQTNTAISIKIIALKQYEPEAEVSAKIPHIRPIAAAFVTVEKIENATNKGIISIGVAVYILKVTPSV